MPPIAAATSMCFLVGRGSRRGLSGKRSVRPALRRPAPERRHPAPERGHPAPERGHPAPERGHPAPERGHPAPERGHPALGRREAPFPAPRSVHRHRIGLFAPGPAVAVGVQGAQAHREGPAAAQARPPPGRVRPRRRGGVRRVGHAVPQQLHAHAVGGARRVPARQQLALVGALQHGRPGRRQQPGAEPPRAVGPRQVRQAPGRARQQTQGRQRLRRLDAQAPLATAVAAGAALTGTGGGGEGPPPLA